MNRANRKHITTLPATPTRNFLSRLLRHVFQPKPVMIAYSGFPRHLIAVGHDAMMKQGY